MKVDFAGPGLARAFEAWWWEWEWCLWERWVEWVGLSLSLSLSLSLGLEFELW